MIDLMQLQAISLYNQKKHRESYKDGFNIALLTRVGEDRSILRLEKNSEKEVNLDDAIVWKQKKVKEKAVQLFSILSGKDIKAKVIRLSIQYLKDNGRFERLKFKAFLVENGYSDKTATAQAAQMVNLFKLLKVINYEGLVNEQSLIWDKCLSLAS